MYADIILPLNLPQLLTYGVPTEMQALLKPGMRVEVALGNNKQYSGVVAALHYHKPETYIVKPIKNIIDTDPIVSELHLQFWAWVGNYYMAAPGEVLQAALPAHLKLIAETSLLWIADENTVFDWTDEGYLAAEALQMKKEISMSDLRTIVGIRHFAPVLNELLEKEAVKINDALEHTYRPRKEKIVTLAGIYSNQNELKLLYEQLKRAPKQIEILMAYTELSIKNKGIVRQAHLLERIDATSTQLKSMVDKGVFSIEEVNVDRILPRNIKELKDVKLSTTQQDAYTLLNTLLIDKNVALLHGVTGSGKTLIYIEKLRECVAAGKQAILMVPEIGLTTQLVGRLYAYFGDSLGVYHSHFSNNERVEIWEKVRKGIYKVVAGTRSALWLPFTDLGLIIADEEHDSSYKQKDPAPRFHARDAAIYLSSLYKAKVILGSATPSVETLYNVQQGKYAYIPLKDRYQGVNMPEIEIINAKSLDTVKQLGVKLITPELQQAMLEAMQNRKQIILFQNRRGYAPFQLCTSCGWVPQCKNCSVSLTYHKSSDRLHCHYCGLKTAIIHTCLRCGGSKMISKSFGTEKIEEEVQQIFPNARIARMDVDSMRGKNSMAELLEKLENNKIDILVGTQMVVKGLDFASVSLVGILSADTLFSYPDFRVNERAFQLMEQVSGRAGRADGKGKVFIQVYNLNHPVLQWVKNHDVHSFYIQEIQYREHFAYPPFSRLIKITFKHIDDAKAALVAKMMADALLTFTGNIVVQGPCPALVSRVRNQYIHEIWVKAQRDNKLLYNLKSFLKTQKSLLLGARGNSNVSIVFDVDPL